MSYKPIYTLDELQKYLEGAAYVLHAFIDSVVIHQATGKRLDREQEVVINFRFIQDNWFIF